MTDKTTELIADLRSPNVFNRAVMLRAADTIDRLTKELEAEHQRAEGSAGALLWASETVSSLAERNAVLAAERDEAEDGLFRVVQTLGFDTDSAANAREFFGPMTYYAGDSEYTKAADIAVAYAAEHRTEMEKESDELEAERDALQTVLDEIRTEMSQASECDEHPEGDPITCGWKSDMIRVRRILSRAIDTKEESNEP